MNYTIGDFLIRIKNAYMSHKKTVVHPYSKVAQAMGTILQTEGYIKSVEEKDAEGKKQLVTTLLYHGRTPAVRDIKIVSKPSIHRYVRRSAVKKTLHDYGINIVSTSQGMMTSREADKKGIGGELVAKILK